MNAKNKALMYLSKHNPLKEHRVDQGEYVRWLLEFTMVHGDQAVIALAGFHMWCMKNIENVHKRKQSLVTTFFHDLTGRNDRFVLPKSAGHGEFFTALTLA